MVRTGISVIRPFSGGGPAVVRRWSGGGPVVVRRWSGGGPSVVWWIQVVVRQVGRVPAKSTLVDMGIDIPDVLCPYCKDQIENVDHVFLKCPWVATLWTRISQWWNMSTLEMPLGSHLVD
ncbi:hypothetical protein LXL04_008204 [Taraxacum kok-saghyz]